MYVIILNTQRDFLTNYATNHIFNTETPEQCPTGDQAS